MKKLVALLLAVLMVATMSCALAENTEKTVLKVAGWDTQVAGSYYLAMEAAYEAANPDIDIELVDIESQNYPTIAGTYLAGGDTTDLYSIKELSHMQTWADNGYLVALNDRIAADGYDMSKYAGMDACYVNVSDGKQYALPFRADFWVLFYNKTLFDAAGVAYPTNDMTWDEYAELAIKMTKDNVYGTHYHTWFSDVANWAVCGSDYTLADGSYDELIYFYQLAQKLEDEGACMSYDELKASGLHYSGAFAQGNIAMMPMGYWYAATLNGYIKDGTANFDWGYVAVPHKEDVAAGSSFGSPTGMAINAKSEHQEEAWKFLSWLCSEEGALCIASTGNRPAYVSEAVAAKMSETEGFPKDEASIAALLPSSIAMEWPVGEGVTEIKNAVNEEHSLIMTRELSIEEGVAEMEERAAEYIK